MYEESAAWPTLSIAAATLGDCSDNENPLYLAPSSAISIDREER
jgi:hypothetical protein